VLDWLTPGGDFPKQEPYAAQPRAGAVATMS
jgi:aspartate carbamoyltransferase catalytic subunit